MNTKNTISTHQTQTESPVWWGSKTTHAPCPPTLTALQGTNDLGWSLPSRGLRQRNYFLIIGSRKVCFEIKMGTVGTSHS